MNIVNPSKLVDDSINIGKLCASYSVKSIIMSSVLNKRSIKFTKIIREVNDKMKEKCHLSSSRFICINVSINCLWKDGINYDHKDINILAEYFNFLIILF